MFADNLKKLREKNNLTQEELALKLHVVRQTISKWEKGLSVPDINMINNISAVFNVSINYLLLGYDSAENENAIAQSLLQINEQLAIKNRRTNFIFKIIGFVLLAIFLFYLFLIVFAVFGNIMFSSSSATQVIVTETTVENIHFLHMLI